MVICRVNCTSPHLSSLFKTEKTRNNKTTSHLSDTNVKTYHYVYGSRNKWN